MSVERWQDRVAGGSAVIFWPGGEPSAPTAAIATTGGPGRDFRPTGGFPTPNHRRRPRLYASGKQLVSIVGCMAMATIERMISRAFDNTWDGVYWLMMEMDVAQWAVLSAIFVATGFMALRTRM